MVELTFYWSLFFSQFVDVKRKVVKIFFLQGGRLFKNGFQDFWEMFVHHVATIALMVLSWTCHLHRLSH